MLHQDFLSSCVFRRVAAGVLVFGLALGGSATVEASAAQVPHNSTPGPSTGSDRGSFKQMNPRSSAPSGSGSTTDRSGQSTPHIGSGAQPGPASPKRPRSKAQTPDRDPHKSTPNTRTNQDGSSSSRRGSSGSNDKSQGDARRSPNTVSPNRTLPGAQGSNPDRKRKNRNKKSKREEREYNPPAIGYRHVDPTPRPPVPEPGPPVVPGPDQGQTPTPAPGPEPGPPPAEEPGYVAECSSTPGKCTIRPNVPGSEPQIIVPAEDCGPTECREDWLKPDPENPGPFYVPRVDTPASSGP